MIIIRGKNYYPEDIEFAATEASPDIRPGCVAAFHVDGDEAEELVLAVEVRAENRVL